jgi:hypothetical protein
LVVLKPSACLIFTIMCTIITQIIFSR